MKTESLSIKDLQTQVSQWEHRLLSAKADNDKLVKQNEFLREEAKNLNAVLEQQAVQKRTEQIKENNRIEEARQKLEKDKADFLVSLTSFKNEKNEFETIKQQTLDAKASAQAVYDKASAFIRVVRENAATL